MSFSAGNPFSTIYGVVLGSEVATKLGYKLGDSIVISHGMGNTSFHHHNDNPFEVVGILNPTGTPVDKTLHIPLAAIDLIHGGNASHEHDEHDEHDHHNVEATYNFNCKTPVMGFSVTLFNLIPSLNALNVQWISNTGQGSAEVTRSNPVISWQS